MWVYIYGWDILIAIPCSWFFEVVLDCGCPLSVVSKEVNVCCMVTVDKADVDVVCAVADSVLAFVIRVVVDGVLVTGLDLNF